MNKEDQVTQKQPMQSETQLQPQANKLSPLDLEDLRFYMEEYGMTQEEALKALQKQRACGF